MSDRNDRDPRAQAEREPEATLDERRRDRASSDTESVLEEPIPGGPNEDRGFLASPPDDVEMNRTSDDNDLNPSGSGVAATPLRKEYETIGMRDALARDLRDVLDTARAFAEEDGSDEARSIARDLADIYERVGVPTEDTDDEPGIPQAEPGGLDTPGRD